MIALLGALAGGLLVWALGMRRRLEAMPSSEKTIERRRAELREEEAAAVEAEQERIDAERKLDLVDWLNRRGGARDRDPGDGVDA